MFGTALRIGCEPWYVLQTLRAIWRRERFTGIDGLLDFAFGMRGRFIKPFQVRDEIEPLLRLLDGRRPRVVLEIGTNNGGTLFLWTRVAAGDAAIISVDLRGGDFGGGYPRWKRPLYRRFALPAQRIHLLQADSHDPTTLARVRALLGSRRLDFLLIDGDHTYEGVKRDFEMYAPLVAPGGVIAFHDIAEHADPSCQVRRFWLELRATPSSREFIATPPAGWAGIGVLIQPDPVEVATSADRGSARPEPGAS